MIFEKKNQENASQKNRAEEVSMADMQEIGRRIAALRKAKNLTQAELAEQLSVSYQAVSNWERGESMPDIFKLPTLAAVLGTSVDALLKLRRRNRTLRKRAVRMPRFGKRFLRTAFRGLIPN